MALPDNNTLAIAVLARSLRGDRSQREISEALGIPQRAIAATERADQLDITYLEKLLAQCSGAPPARRLKVFLERSQRPQPARTPKTWERIVQICEETAIAHGTDLVTINSTFFPEILEKAKLKSDRRGTRRVLNALGRSPNWEKGHIPAAEHGRPTNSKITAYRLIG